MLKSIKINKSHKSLYHVQLLSSRTEAEVNEERLKTFTETVSGHISLFKCFDRE